MIFNARKLLEASKSGNMQLLKEMKRIKECNKIELLLCQNQLLYFKMKVILVRLYYLDYFNWVSLVRLVIFFRLV